MDNTQPTTNAWDRLVGKTDRAFADAPAPVGPNQTRQIDPQAPAVGNVAAPVAQDKWQAAQDAVRNQ